MSPLGWWQTRLFLIGEMKQRSSFTGSRSIASSWLC